MAHFSFLVSLAFPISRGERKRSLMVSIIINSQILDQAPKSTDNFYIREEKRRAGDQNNLI